MPLIFFKGESLKATYQQMLKDLKQTRRFNGTPLFLPTIFLLVILMKITIRRVATKKIFTSLIIGLLLFSTLFAFSSGVIVHAASVDSLPISVSSGVAAVTITDSTNPSYSATLTSFPTTFSYQDGDSLTFSVTPVTGYSFADWAFTFVSNRANTIVFLNPYTQPTYSGWSLFAECALSTPQNCFGYTSIGSSTEQISGSNSKLYGTEFSLPYSTLISSMSVYLSGSIAAPYPTAEVAFYSTNYTLIADSSNQSITTKGWYTFSVSTTLSAGNYFLVVYGQSSVWTSGNYLTVYYESLASGLSSWPTALYQANPSTFPTWPTTISSPTSFGYYLSIYANFTKVIETEPTTPNPTPTPISSTSSGNGSSGPETNPSTVPSQTSQAASPTKGTRIQVPFWFWVMLAAIVAVSVCSLMVALRENARWLVPKLKSLF